MSRHPWGPWGRQSSGVICIWKIYQLFCDSGAALVDFFTFMQMLPNVSFIIMVIKKSFFVSINSHNFKFSTEMHSLKAYIIMKHLNQKLVSVIFDVMVYYRLVYYWYSSVWVMRIWIINLTQTLAYRIQSNLTHFALDPFWRESRRDSGGTK